MSQTTVNNNMDDCKQIQTEHSPNRSKFSDIHAVISDVRLEPNVATVATEEEILSLENVSSVTAVESLCSYTTANIDALKILSSENVHYDTARESLSPNNINSDTSIETLRSESVRFATENIECSKTISVGTSVETFHPELISVATSICSLHSDNTDLSKTSVETGSIKHVRFNLSDETSFSSLADTNMEGLPTDKVTPDSFNIKDVNHIMWALGILAYGTERIQTDGDPTTTVKEESVATLQTITDTSDSGITCKSSLVELNEVQTIVPQVEFCSVSQSNSELAKYTLKPQGLQQKRSVSTRTVSPSFTDYYHQRSEQQTAQLMKKKVRNRSKSVSPCRNKPCTTLTEPIRSCSPFQKRRTLDGKGCSGSSEPNILPEPKPFLESPQSTETETKRSFNQNKNRSVSQVKLNYTPFDSPKPPKSRSDTYIKVDKNKHRYNTSPFPVPEQHQRKSLLILNSSPSPSRFSKTYIPLHRTDMRRRESPYRRNKSPSPLPRTYKHHNSSSIPCHCYEAQRGEPPSHPTNKTDNKEQRLLNLANLKLDPTENLATTNVLQYVTPSKSSNARLRTKPKIDCNRDRSLSPRKSKPLTASQSRWKQDKVSMAVFEPKPLQRSAPFVNSVDPKMETKSETLDITNSKDLWKFGILKGLPKPRKKCTTKVQPKKEECLEASDTVSHNNCRNSRSCSPYWCKQKEKVDLEGIMEHVFGMSENYRTSELVLDPDLLVQAKFDIRTFMDPSDGEEEYPNRVDVFQQPSYRPGFNEKLSHKFNGPGGNIFDMERVRRRVSKKIWA